MPSTLDNILEKESRIEEARLAQAAHAADWSQTFSGAQSTETLRAQRNVTDLVNSAIERKMMLAAQTDKNAQEIYQKNVKFQQWQEEAPLRDQLLRNKIDAQGAASRFAQFKDAQTNEHVSGFMEHMINAPDETDPGYEKYVLGGLAKYHRVATTSVGKDMLTGIAKSHEVAAKIAAAVTPAAQYYDAATLQKENPGAQYRQDPKTGGYVVTAGPKTATTAESQPASQYASPEALLKDNPGAKYRQDPKTGGYIVTMGGGKDTSDDKRYNAMFKQAYTDASMLARKYGVDVQYNEEGFPSIERTKAIAGPAAAKDDPAKETRTAFYKEVKGLGLTPYAFENEEAWKTRADGKKFYKDSVAKQTVTLDAKRYEQLRSQYDAIHGIERTTPTPSPAPTPSPTVTPSPTPEVKRRKYNPATGKLE